MLARLSIKWKLMMLVIVIVALSTYLLGRMMYQGLAEMLATTIGLRAETVADSIATLVHDAWFDPNLGDYTSDPKFKEVEAQLSGLIAKGYVDRVEFIRIIGKQQVEYVLSVPADGSADYYPSGYREQISAGSLFNHRDAGHGYVEFASGLHAAGWVPVRINGTAGLVLVYINATDIEDALNTANLAILLTIIALVLSAAYVTYKFAATFEKTAVTDGLMGIYNHKFFKQRLEQEVAKSARYGQQTSLVLLDIDFFKRVNDTYGHTTGDIVLKTLAKIVSETCRNTDVVARYGGEEVGVILTHTGVAGAQEFAERLRLKISHHVISDPEEKAEFRVTVSIGVAQWEKGLQMLDMIKRADAALYHSKHTGRNRVTIYQDDILPAPENPQPKTTER